MKRPLRATPPPCRLVARNRKLVSRPDVSSRTFTLSLTYKYNGLSRHNNLQSRRCSVVADIVSQDSGASTHSQYSMPLIPSSHQWQRQPSPQPYHSFLGYLPRAKVQSLLPDPWASCTSAFTGHLTSKIALHRMKAGAGNIM